MWTSTWQSSWPCWMDLNDCMHQSTFKVGDYLPTCKALRCLPPNLTGQLRHLSQARSCGDRKLQLFDFKRAIFCIKLQHSQHCVDSIPTATAVTNRTILAARMGNASGQHCVTAALDPI